VTRLPQRWINYPQGIQVMIGGNYKFDFNQIVFIYKSCNYLVYSAGFLFPIIMTFKQQIHQHHYNYFKIKIDVFS
jgi:hypothetical protein